MEQVDKKVAHSKAQIRQLAIRKFAVAFTGIISRMHKQVYCLSVALRCWFTQQILKCTQVTTTHKRRCRVIATFSVFFCRQLVLSSLGLSEHSGRPAQLSDSLSTLRVSSALKSEALTQHSSYCRQFAFRKESPCENNTQFGSVELELTPRTIAI